MSVSLVFAYRRFYNKNILVCYVNTVPNMYHIETLLHDISDKFTVNDVLRYIHSDEFNTTARTYITHNHCQFTDIIKNISFQQGIMYPHNNKNKQYSGWYIHRDLFDNIVEWAYCNQHYT